MATSTNKHFVVVFSRHNSFSEMTAPYYDGITGTALR